MRLKFVLIFIGLITLSFTNHNPEVGAVLDNYNGVPIYYNGFFKNTNGRNLTKDGYNLGLKWQCIEFVKRYYYLKYGHKMPDSYGHAKDFFDDDLSDQEFNEARNMLQFRNTRRHKPQVDDLVIYGPSKDNPFGHMGIISAIKNGKVTLVQQNMGTKTRQKLILAEYDGIYTIADFNIKGWLRINK
ncbi:CHAP domain-containing protein [Portibacter lacus]|uniref:CHAP domain-containing protein n=1 Tax=Portibacter lacus TaxID=1099794 RepID=A0AA37SN14_9BACT|nr:CHAP domain-containing protein [Portibacter lacus]GLR16384.1 CHAP domain-containing protein [Portibacter lacus]